MNGRFTVEIFEREERRRITTTMSQIPAVGDYVTAVSDITPGQRVDQARVERVDWMPADTVRLTVWEV